MTNLSPDKTVLVTGATGSFGSSMMAHYLSEIDGPRLRLLNRNEDNQLKARKANPSGPRATWIIGDVRDLDCLRVAANGVDRIVHAAALKHVRTGEVHPDEVYKTNIGGSVAVVEAAIQNSVPKSLLISTDKATSPVNGYGSSKHQAERIFIQGNRRGLTRGAMFACVRGGNVWGSNGSVTKIWRNQKSDGVPLVITDPDATRFHLVMSDWVKFCERALEEMTGGEIFLPKVRAWRLGDLAEAYGHQSTTIGLQSGEKKHEFLFSPEDSDRIVDIGWAYVLEPPDSLRSEWNYAPRKGLRPNHRMEYTSETADRLSIDELKELICKNL